MVPKVAGKGSSFKGAALYYLHDKGADTAERVAFTCTENLLTNDPERAIKCMAYTAMHQSEIKIRAGGSAKGRKLTQPVYTYSLSWHPDQEPTKEQMIEAAQQTLRVLDLSEHEALFVSHHDEPHPHIHVIVNRVHPDTGIAAKLSKDHLKLSRWAEDYERNHGQILCRQRVENNRRRQKGEFLKDDNANIYDWRRQRLREDFERRLARQKDLTDKQVSQRMELYDAKERLMEQEREQTRNEHRRHWRVLYLKQEQERAKLELEQQTRRGRLHELLKKPSGEVLRMSDAHRTGAMSGYFKDTATRTKGEDPVTQKRREDRIRKRAERERADALKDVLKDKTAIQRDRQDRTGKMAGHFDDRADPLPANKQRTGLSGQHARHSSETEALTIKHARQRRTLGEKIDEKQKAKFKEINTLYKEQLAALEEEQTKQRDRLAKDHSRESQQTARDIKEGRDRQEFKRQQRGKGYSAFRDLKDDNTRDRNQDRDDDSPDRSRKGPGSPDKDK